MKQLIHMCGCHGKSKIVVPDPSPETWNFLSFWCKKNPLFVMNIFLDTKTGSRL